METNEKSRVLDMTKGKSVPACIKICTATVFWKSATAVL